MSVAVNMPQLGENVTEGTVTRWLKKEGEHVTVDEPLLEVSTDKVDTEIPSPATGILRGISVDEDETVAVGAQLAVIEKGADTGADAAAPAFYLPPSTPPILHQFGHNLTLGARNGELDPVIGREKEIERVMQVLSRRTKNNPVLIGPPGIGKTTVVEGLAQVIANGDVPVAIRLKHLYTLDLDVLREAAASQSDSDTRMQRILRDIRGRGDVILFIGELRNLATMPGVAGGIDVGTPLMSALVRGGLQVICTTSTADFQRLLSTDPALQRTFMPVPVAESTVEHTIEILRGLRGRYEAHHGVSITDGALVAAAELADRLLPDRCLPGKAVDLIDEAGSWLRIRPQAYAIDAVAEVDEGVIAKTLAVMLGRTVTDVMSSTPPPRFAPAAATDDDREIWSIA